jgi:hypothetical protein
MVILAADAHLLPHAEEREEGQRRKKEIPKPSSAARAPGEAVTVL